MSILGLLVSGFLSFVLISATNGTSADALFAAVIFAALYALVKLFVISSSLVYTLLRMRSSDPVGGAFKYWAVFSAATFLLLLAATAIMGLHVSVWLLIPFSIIASMVEATVSRR